MSPPGLAAPAVFVSYASADRATAEAASAYLEARGVRCWMAPRDVPAGALYADAIVRAINDSSTLLLLLSHNSLGSAHVGKELERASSKGKRIIAMRLDDAPLTPAFEYFLSESQWIDIAADGRETGFARLLQALSEPSAAQGLPPAAAPRRVRSRAPVLLSAALALVAILAALWLWRTRQGIPAAAANTTAAVEKSVAVLPFADMSEAHDQGYFADGMAEEILDQLAKIPSLKVIARTSSFQFKDKAEDVRVVGDKLGVATVLEGSVRKAGERMRITAQLVRTSDGSHMWSEVYDRETRDVFRIQDEIAAAVVAALKASLLGSTEKRAAPTTNTEAYALYLQGLSHLRSYSGADSAKAREYFERATTLDPDFAQAWAQIAVTYGNQEVFGSHESFGLMNERIATAAHRALALDPTLAEAHVALANMGFIDYDLAKMRSEVQSALQNEPDNVSALGLSVFMAIAECRLGEAEQLSRRIIERDPLSVDPYRGLATALWFKGDAPEAAATYRRLLAVTPGAESMHYRLAQVLISEGRTQEALKELDAEGSPSWQAIGRAMAYGALGQNRESDQQLRIAEARDQGLSYQAAQIYANRHDREATFAWLERARQAHDPGLLTYVKCDPSFAQLRADPRFATLLAQLHLSP